MQFYGPIYSCGLLFMASSKTVSTGAVVYYLREETVGNYQLSTYHPVLEFVH